ncbi:vitamin K-dependent gamma-carboxylase [Pectinophora gossypiella]|uniref:vitamin K-dependent gamma-carboxylase n=1 Tax=Pectinophora gossypiella TaxID=13191 RepID=UPI00214F4B98|nr:vitamin K-dependent gamma-carboxylase [Pectinophora gossypiella]
MVITKSLKKMLEQIRQIKALLMFMLMRMKIKEKVKAIYEGIDKQFVEQFGFRIKETTFENLVNYLHAPKDSSSLAVTRIFYGLAMLFDIPDERGGTIMDRRWGDPNMCHFPLFPFIRALPMPYMALVYAALWIGALGIMLGYKYRFTSIMFTTCYWYLFLIEKSFWNNHSYLFGLAGLLLSCTQAHCFWSIDVYLDPSKLKTTVPYWNYFVLKYQFFILYFMAGMKKGTAEWLTGYSVQNLSEHWVFEPFKFFLTVPQIDYLIVHWFIFVFDLTVAVWMMWSRTRHVAMVFCAMFHLMNSRLFRIGMFPWVCLATMPLYYPFNWPKQVLHFLKKQFVRLRTIICSLNCINSNKMSCNCNVKDGQFNDKDGSGEKDKDTKTIDDQHKLSHEFVGNCDELMKDEERSHQEDIKNITDTTEQTRDKTNEHDVNTQKADLTRQECEVKCDVIKSQRKDCNRKKLTTSLIIFYVVIQAFLPYSHFVTKGYNNWTSGLYGYSWDMMVHTWDTHSVVIQVVDNENLKEYYLDPSVYTPNDRWTRHGDMIYQYAHCLKENLVKKIKTQEEPKMSTNLSIYVEVWSSMNGRFTQRMFDSKADLLKVSWSPFERLSFLMPILDEALHWRSTLQEITDDVHSWTNGSDVVFIADFPNYVQVKYMPMELKNISLTVLEGDVAYETEVTSSHNGQTYRLTSGNRIGIDSGLFHRVLNIGENPAYYMYTFVNSTDVNNDANMKIKPKLPIISELYVRFRSMLIFAVIIGKSVIQILFGCNGNC